MYRNKPILEVYEDKNVKFKYIFHNGNDCPICSRSVFGSSIKDKFCQPLRKVIISGFWFWAKKCPIDTFHKHYYCEDCKAEWLGGNYKLQVEEVDF